ncbi:MAG: tyrosine-type recombinase/integrase [Pseudobdellovibrio sp.]
MEIIKGKKSISYRVSIHINGKKIKSPLFLRKTDCNIWLNEQRQKKIQQKIYGSYAQQINKITTGDYAKMWLKTKESQGVSRSTLENYERYLRVHFLPRFSSQDLRQIEKKHIEQLQLELKKSHNAKGVNVIITAIKGLFREAVRDGYLLKSPCEFIKSLKGDSLHDVYWTKSEIDQFLQANFGHDLYDLFLISINTGMRKGELAGLCWDRVSFQENTISVTRTRDRHGLKERTKTGIKRVVPMNSITRATLLKVFRFQSGQSKFVFADSKGIPIETHHLYRDFEKAQIKAGMSRTIRFHDLRHTFASQFMLNGGNIYDLQKILGHTSIVMTQRYAHISQEHLQKAMSRFELGTADLNTNCLVFPDGQRENVVFYPQNSDDWTQNRPKILEA